LADQEALVAGVRERTGTLLAAHALVASFLGATTIREIGLDVWAWLAVMLLLSAVTTPKPVPPSEIKTPSTSIGIDEGRGGSSPDPRPEPPQK
jgi:uncharacterized protein YbjT (DUF2867 family)